MKLIGIYNTDTYFIKLLLTIQLVTVYHFCQDTLIGISDGIIKALRIIILVP